jgi:hypothetical protein
MNPLTPGPLPQGGEAETYLIHAVSPKGEREKHTGFESPLAPLGQRAGGEGVHTFTVLRETQ